jgi:hypothetical protein
MLTYTAFNEALRIYMHDVYLHDVKVSEGRQDLHMHTSAYVGILWSGAHCVSKLAAAASVKGQTQSPGVGAGLYRLAKHRAVSAT